MSPLGPVLGAYAAECVEGASVLKNSLTGTARDLHPS